MALTFSLAWDKLYDPDGVVGPGAITEGGQLINLDSYYDDPSTRAVFKFTPSEAFGIDDFDSNATRFKWSTTSRSDASGVGQCEFRIHVAVRTSDPDNFEVYPGGNGWTSASVSVPLADGTSLADHEADIYSLLASVLPASGTDVDATHSIYIQIGVTDQSYSAYETAAVVVADENTTHTTKAATLEGVVSGGGGGSVTAKSVVFDITGNWTDDRFVGIRSIDFKRNGTLIPLTASDFTAYVNSSFGSANAASLAFVTALSKTGSHDNTGWLSGSYEGTNHRLIVVFDTPQEFDEIVANNNHISGSHTDRGARNVKITISPDAITDTTHNAAVSNGTELNNTEWPEHVASDTADDQTVWTAPPGGNVGSQTITGDIASGTDDYRVRSSDGTTWIKDAETATGVDLNRPNPSDIGRGFYVASLTLSSALPESLTATAATLSVSAQLTQGTPPSPDRTCRVRLARTLPADADVHDDANWTDAVAFTANGTNGEHTDHVVDIATALAAIRAESSSDLSVIHLRIDRDYVDANPPSVAIDAFENSANYDPPQITITAESAPTAPTVTSQSTGDTTPIVSGGYTEAETDTLAVTVNATTYTAGTDAELTTSGDTWQLDLSSITPLTPATYDVTATATNSVGSTDDESSGELTILPDAPTAPTVTPLTTGDTTPVISGGYTAAETDTLTVAVNGTTYTAGTDPELTTSGDTWQLDLSNITPLALGTYQVVATATNTGGNTADVTSNELAIVDVPTAPTVTTQTTSDTTPIIAGGFTAAETSTLTVTVNGTTYTAGTDAELTTSGDTWQLDLSSITPLTTGVYAVTATASNAAGSTSDATTDELTIVEAPDVPTVTTESTVDTTPIIEGTFDSVATNVLTVAIGGVTYTAGTDAELTTSGDAWQLDLSSIAPLPLGVYDVAVTSSNDYGSASDATTNEVEIVATPTPDTPETTAADTYRFRGDAPAVAQRVSIEWTETLAGRLVEFRCDGQRAYFVVPNSIESETAVEFVAWWNSSERPPSFARARASIDANRDDLVILTAATAGVSFRPELGDVAVGITVSLALTQRSRGPQHLDDPKNWQPIDNDASAMVDRFGRVPGTGDVLRIDSGRVDITEGTVWRAPLTRSSGTLYARGGDFRVGQRVQVASDGTLPTGLAAATTYQVASFDWISGAITFKTDAGSPVSVTGDGAGAHVVYVELARIELVGDFAGSIGDPLAMFRPSAFAVQLADADRNADDLNAFVHCGAGSVGLDVGDSRLDLRIRSTGGSSRNRAAAIELENSNTDSRITLLEGSIAIAPRPGQAGTIGPLVAHGGQYVLGENADIGSVDSVNATSSIRSSQVRGRIRNE